MGSFTGCANSTVTTRPGLVKSLTRLDLIDEHHLLTQPIILGGGLPLS